jgi:ribosome-binding ATPase YchF (GTP1/OBG family)
MEPNAVEIAMQMLRLQLQDTLTIVGKMLLKNTSDELPIDEDESLQAIKQIMNNPFREIIKVCSELEVEYERFRNSKEVRDSLDLIKAEMEENPDIVDKLFNSTPEETEEILDKLKNKKDENLQ